jgi:histidyl-tRNA synthetase
MWIRIPSAPLTIKNKVMEIKQDFVYKGTRILFENKAKEKRNIINKGIEILTDENFNEIFIPIIQFQSTFTEKVGEENSKMMFEFQDRGNREICLAPEYTAVIQKLAETQFKFTKDVRIFYLVECFRGERPQKGRYRQFTQLGVEIINPTKDYTNYLAVIASKIIGQTTDDYDVNFGVTRGLDYYTEGKGFEITVKSLGAQKQVLGGGSYERGIGFAIGIDRLTEI